MNEIQKAAIAGSEAVIANHLQQTSICLDSMVNAVNRIWTYDGLTTAQWEVYVSKLRSICQQLEKFERDWTERR